MKIIERDKVILMVLILALSCHTFFLGFCEIIGQGVCVGHDEGRNQNEVGGTTQKRGYG
jgi:hypothetical protein